MTDELVWVGLHRHYQSEGVYHLRPRCFSTKYVARVVRADLEALGWRVCKQCPA